MSKEIKSICVYCGSNFGSRSEYRDAARLTGEILAKENISLIYGGGNVGLMGILADSTLHHGGKVIGVIPKKLADSNVAHQELSNLIVVDSMHERKKVLFDLADGFIALPGGIGTLEEILEIVTWSQLGFHDKPYGLLNTSGFFDSLLQLLKDMVICKFLKQQHLDSLFVDDNPRELLTSLRSYKYRYIDKWMNL